MWVKNNVAHVKTDKLRGSPHNLNSLQHDQKW
nr:MAG TPA: hypothetical protein [Caudoviricetes sp.]